MPSDKRSDQPQEAPKAAKFDLKPTEQRTPARPIPEPGWKMSLASYPAALAEKYKKSWLPHQEAVRLIPDPADKTRYWVSYKPKAVEPKPVSKMALGAASGGATDSESASGGRGFTSIVGQETAIKRLKEFVALYSQSGKPPAHVLLTGSDGIGKRTLARTFLAEYCGKLTEVDARELKKFGDLVGKMTNLAEGDALLVADVAKIPRGIMNAFALALKEFQFDIIVDKGPYAKTLHIPLKRFTCIATARSKAECPTELTEAFLTVPLQSYSRPELVGICEHLAQRKGIAITPAAVDLVVGTSTGTPHHIEVLVDRLVELGRTTISAEDVIQVLSVLGFGTKPIGPNSQGEIDTLPGVQFEKVIATLLQAMGFRTEMTEVSGDGGIDIIATLDRALIGGRYLIQCKRFAPGNLVGAATVRDFYGAVTADRQAVKGILITTSGFTSQALAFAQQLPMELIGGQQLRALLVQQGISTESQSGLDSLFE